MNGNSVLLSNGLSVSIDWLEFTIFDPSTIDDIISLLNLSKDDFILMDKGAQGYKSRLQANFGAMSILYNGNDNMGIHVKMPGSSIPYIVESFKKSLVIECPFGGTVYDVSFDSTVVIELLRAILNIGKITRLDLAIDDIGENFFSMDDVQHIMETCSYVSKFNHWDMYKRHSSKAERKGYTIYLGSRSSALCCRIYDKALEQNLDDAHWVRWELELKNDRACSAAEKLICGMDLGSVAVGILSNYFRVIVKDNPNISRCSIDERWQAFIDGVSKLKLFIPSEEKTLEEKEVWIDRQVMPTIAALTMYYGNLDFIKNRLDSGAYRMSPHLRSLVDEAERAMYKQ